MWRSHVNVGDPYTTILGHDILLACRDKYLENFQDRKYKVSTGREASFRYRDLRSGEYTIVVKRRE
jgi:hypothetical protein